MQTRESLQTSMLEGALGELATACAAGGVLTAWALYLDLSPLLIGVLGALPVTAQFVQLPAAWITRRLGSRRTALWTVALSRQLVLPLACLPFVHVAHAVRQAIFLSCTFASSALGVFGTNAWTAWMGALVPDRVRGRTFGIRAAVCGLAATASALVAGYALDAGRNRGYAGAALCALTLVASLAGLFNTLMMRRQRDPGRAGAARPVAFSETLAPLRDVRGRKLLLFQLAWCASGGVALAFYPLHMIGNLRMSFAAMALYAAGLAAAGTLAAPLWGRAMDRVGARPVLALCAFALCLSPPIWLFVAPGRLWPLALDALLCGAANAGIALAIFALPIGLAEPEQRPFYVGTLAAVGGAATGIGSALGGVFARSMPASWSLLGQHLHAEHALFLLGGAARFCSAFLALRIAERPLAPVRELPLRGEPGRAKIAA